MYDKKEDSMAHSFANRLKGTLAALIALAAALVLVPGTAFAAPIGGNSLTVTGVEDGDQVTIYQVVQTDVDEFNVAQNDFVADFGIDFDDWAAADSSEAEGHASTIAQYINANPGEWGEGGHAMYGPIEAAGGEAVFRNIEAGQYLVVVTSEHDATRVYQNTIVSVTPDTDAEDFVPVDAEATLKYTDMDADEDGSVVVKKINGEDAVDNVDANDTVRFTISAPIPRYVHNFDTRTFKLNDSMDDGFVYVDGSLRVMVGNVPLTEGMEYTVAQEPDGSYMLALTSVALQVYAGQTLSISYDATLAQDGNAPVYRTAEENDVTLTFSSNSNDDATSTASDSVFMVVYGITFTKVSSEDQSALKGAVFEVRDLDGNVIATATSDANGLVSIDGALAAGEQYVLVETQAPAGYQTIDELRFSIKSKDYADTHVGYQYEVNGGTVEDDPSNFFTELPTTGGAGTVALTAAGVVLMAGAAAFIVRSRKQDN